MRTGIDDRDRPAHAGSKNLDQIALRFVAKRRQRNHFGKQPTEALVIGIEIEAAPFDGLLFEPTRKSAQCGAFPNVPTSLHGDDESVTDGGFHG
jgi:hypothetical protein